MSQAGAGRSHPGARHVRSRQRTKSASFADGVYRGSALSAGSLSGTNRAEVASSAITSAGIRPSPPAPLQHTPACRSGTPAAARPRPAPPTHPRDAAGGCADPPGTHCPPTPRAADPMPARREPTPCPPARPSPARRPPHRRDDRWSPSCPAHRNGIGIGHDLIDRRGQSAARQRRTPRQPHRQCRIHPRQHLGIGDQLGAKHDRLKRPVVDLAGLKHPAHLRQPVTHRHRIAQVAMPHRHAAMQPGRHLRGRRVPRVSTPLRLLTRITAAHHQQLPDRHQPLRGRLRLPPRRLTHPIQQCSRLRRGPRSVRVLEHVATLAGAADKLRPAAMAPGCDAACHAAGRR